MAAYAHGFVVSIIGPHGNIREASDGNDRVARLPYESEYKIRIKNKNSLRAKVSVLVDGMDISPGRMFILAANETVDLERFIQDGDLDKGNKFKFVNAIKGAATGEIQDPHNPNLGVVEVRFYREITSYLTTSGIGGMLFGGSFGHLSVNNSGGSCVNGISNTGSANTSSASFKSQSGAANCTTAAYHAGTPTMSGGVIGTSQPLDLPADKGGTAMGAESAQKFSEHYGWFSTELSPVAISIRLKGLKQAVVQPAPAPITVPSMFSTLVTSIAMSTDPEYQSRQILELTEQRDKAVEYLNWALSLIDEDFQAGGNIGFAEVIVWKAAKGFCKEHGKTE
jgi:hypothetical protein